LEQPEQESQHKDSIRRFYTESRALKSMHKLAKAGIMREVKDYAYITLGLISYSLGWAHIIVDQ